MDVARLYELRLRTPRLELRPPSREEPVELREAARAVCDRVNRRAVLGGLGRRLSWEARLAAWRPDEWGLALGVWSDEGLMGIQDLIGRDFAAARRFGTGSWLGAPFGIAVGST